MHDAAESRGSWRPGSHHWPVKCAHYVTVTWLAISTAQQGPTGCCLMIHCDGHSLMDPISGAQHAGDTGKDSNQEHTQMSKHRRCRAHPCCRSPSAAGAGATCLSTAVPCARLHTQQWGGS